MSKHCPSPPQTTSHWTILQPCSHAVEEPADLDRPLFLSSMLFRKMILASKSFGMSFATQEEGSLMCPWCRQFGVADRAATQNAECLLGHRKQNTGLLQRLRSASWEPALPGIIKSCLYRKGKTFSHAWEPWHSSQSRGTHTTGD